MWKKWIWGCVSLLLLLGANLRPCCSVELNGRTLPGLYDGKTLARAEAAAKAAAEELLPGPAAEPASAAGQEAGAALISGGAGHWEKLEALPVSGKGRQASAYGRSALRLHRGKKRKRRIRQRRVSGHGGGCQPPAAENPGFHSLSDAQRRRVRLHQR